MLEKCQEMSCSDPHFCAVNSMLEKCLGMSFSDPHNANAQPDHYFGAMNAMLDKCLVIIDRLVANLKCVCMSYKVYVGHGARCKK